MITVEQHGPITCIRMARSFLGKPLYWTAAYWVDGLLIDTGPRSAAPELLRILKQVPVERIVITHGHEDHTGGLATLQSAYPKAAIYASARTIPLIENPTLLNMQLYRRVIWNVPQSVQGVIPLDRVDNMILTERYTFRAVETPGHSPDHISYFEPSHRWLFCGDAFIGGQDRACHDEFDLLTTMGTLHTLVSLQCERLFPGSGNARRTASSEIGDKIIYFKWLAAEVARLDANGLSTSQMITSLFNEEPSLTFWTRGHFSATRLINACRAYNEVFSTLPFSASSELAPSLLADTTEDHSDDILSQLKLDDIFANFDDAPNVGKRSDKPSPDKKSPDKKSTDPKDRKR